MNILVNDPISKGCIFTDITTMFTKDGLDGKKMQGKSENARRKHSFRASKRAPA